MLKEYKNLLLCIVLVGNIGNNSLETDSGFVFP